MQARMHQLGRGRTYSFVLSDKNGDGEDDATPPCIIVKCSGKAPVTLQLDNMVLVHKATVRPACSRDGSLLEAAVIHPIARCSVSAPGRSANVSGTGLGVFCAPGRGGQELGLERNNVFVHDPLAQHVERRLT